MRNTGTTDITDLEILVDKLIESRIGMRSYIKNVHQISRTPENFFQSLTGRMCKCLLASVLIASAAGCAGSVPEQESGLDGNPMNFDPHSELYMYGKVEKIIPGWKHDFYRVKIFNTNNLDRHSIDLRDDWILTTQPIETGDYLLLCYSMVVFSSPPAYEAKILFRIPGEFDMEDSLNNSADWGGRKYSA